mmetsp:Transcript_23984/g.42890  ORF Transcript_23984/g.42890 Transcript_23984/m.42890 type:complete len:99 (-) Transcript_23984:171-467(-)
MATQKRCSLQARAVRMFSAPKITSLETFLQLTSSKATAIYELRMLPSSFTSCRIVSISSGQAVCPFATRDRNRVAVANWHHVGMLAAWCVSTAARRRN